MTCDYCGRSARLTAFEKEHSRQCEAIRVGEEVNVDSAAEPVESTLTGLARVQLLASVALVDGTLDPAEKVLLIKHCYELGVAERELDNLSGSPIPETLKGAGPGTSGRQALVGDLVELLLADEQLDPGEMKLLVKIAAAFDVDETQVLALAEHIKKRALGPEVASTNAPKTSRWSRLLLRGKRRRREVERRIMEFRAEYERLCKVYKEHVQSP